ncbi:hypothetical protein R6Q57_013081 [Mikania cordata]
MMVDEKETTNGHGFDLNCSIGLKIEAEDSGKGRLLLDGSNGGVSFGDGNSAERFRIYTRRKRKSTSYSDEITKVEFDDKVWTKLQQVGNEMTAIAKNLSDKSRTHYEQIVWKPRTAEAHGCQGCGEKADVRNCLVCDSCEDIYHLSCSELVGTEIPPSNWYCASCVSNGIGSPHDKCIVCEMLKPVASTSLVNGIPTTDESQNVPNGLDQQLHDATDQNRSSNICFICKYETASSWECRVPVGTAHLVYADSALWTKMMIRLFFVTVVMKRIICIVQNRSFIQFQKEIGFAGNVTGN